MFVVVVLITIHVVTAFCRRQTSVAMSSQQPVPLSCLYVQRPGDGELQLPLPLIRAAYEHLLFARQEASRAAKELAELKASRVQHIPPSTWVKREAKYKMDQEKYEHTISMLNQRIERLESELHVLQEGANLRPLEEKIKVAACFPAS